jgi:hypothetical protein
LAAGWPIGRLVEIWNGFAGVAPFGNLKPAKKFENRQKAVARIWKAIQALTVGDTGGPVAPEPATATTTTRKPKKAAKTPKNAPKAKTTAKAQQATAPREGNKTTQVIAMLQRKNGATLAEIMKSMGWQKHTVRGFMAGAMKKAGYQVESFKSDKGDRTYRIAHVRREVLKGAKQCN